MDSRGHVVSCDDRICFPPVWWFKGWIPQKTKWWLLHRLSVYKEAALRLQFCMPSWLKAQRYRYPTKHSACGSTAWYDGDQIQPWATNGKLDWAVPHSLCIFWSHHNALWIFVGKSMQKGSESRLSLCWICSLVLFFRNKLANSIF
jgi:hypothetical protein